MKDKGTLHKRNFHQGRYDLAVLSEANPQLKQYIRLNPRKEQTVDFSDPEAVKELNRALLMHFYGLTYWDIPEGYLCPPIPGRADYIHYSADLLLDAGNRKNFRNQHIKVLDIGTGANLIYPIIGSQAYGWDFTASDIDSVSVRSAQKIIDNNDVLRKKVCVLQQADPSFKFEGVVQPGDYFHLVVCNPPFFKSKAEAAGARQRKARNLSRSSARPSVSRSRGDNFGGVANELYCPGGELKFLKSMILESKGFGAQVGWFTSLVSDGNNLKILEKVIHSVGAVEVKVIPMSQGQKASRLLAWTFKSPKQLKALLGLAPPVTS